MGNEKPEQAKPKITLSHAEESWKGTKVDQKVITLASAGEALVNGSSGSVVFVTKAHATKAQSVSAKKD